MQKFQSAKSLANPILECFIFLIYSSELFLSVILYDIVHINLSSFKECSCNIRISVITNFYLLTLDLYLLEKRQFSLFFFGLNCYTLSFFLLNSELSISFTSHIFNQLFLILLIFLFLNSVKFNLSFNWLLLSDSLGLLHFFCVSYSIFLSLFGFFLLSLFSDFTSFFSQLFEFSFGFLRRKFWFFISLTLQSQLLFKIRLIFMLLNPFLCRLNTCIAYDK